MGGEVEAKNASGKIIETQNGVVLGKPDVMLYLFSVAVLRTFCVLAVEIVELSFPLNPIVCWLLVDVRWIFSAISGIKVV